MSDVASALMIGPEFSFEGQTLRVSPRTLEVEALCEKDLTSDALKAVQRHKDILAPDEWAAQMDGWRRDCASGVYAFASPFYWQWSCSPRGMKSLAFWSLAVVPGNKGVDRALVERLWDDAAAWEEMHLKMNEANAEKNRKAAAATTSP